MKIEELAQDIIDRFAQFDDWEDSYREVIKIGKNDEGLPESSKVEKYIVKGCQSQVWLVPSYQNGVIDFKSDSDAFIVKGIAALLCRVYSGSSPDEILNFKRDFLKEIGIKDHLSLNRTNGLAHMFKQIQMYAVAYKSLYDKKIFSL